MDLAALGSRVDGSIRPNTRDRPEGRQTRRDVPSAPGRGPVTPVTKASFAETLAETGPAISSRERRERLAQDGEWTGLEPETSGVTGRRSGRWHKESQAAHLDSAQVSGAKGRRFESCRRTISGHIPQIGLRQQRRRTGSLRLIASENRSLTGQLSTLSPRIRARALNKRALLQSFHDVGTEANDQRTFARADGSVPPLSGSAHRRHRQYRQLQASRQEEGFAQPPNLTEREESIATAKIGSRRIDARTMTHR